MFAPRTLLVAGILLPALAAAPSASAHGLLGAAEIGILFEVIDTLEQHCVKATVFIAIVSTVPADWTESWSYHNRYNPLPGAPVEVDQGGDGHGPHGVLGADQHSHVAYDRCFAGGAHGDLTIDVHVVGKVGNVIIDEHSRQGFCHWGHGTHCV